MLIQFIVENFRSFKEETIFNMSATAYTELLHHVTHTNQGKETDVLRTAALYGANASGKTNLIEAMEFARNLIVEGTYGEQAIDTEPFLLSNEQKKKPSRFEFIIKHEGKLYHYGFLVSRQRIEEEWLYATPKVREQKCFERITSAEGKVTVESGTGLAAKNSKGEQLIQFVAETTRPNQLFLKELFEKNNQKIKPIFNWFRSVLTIIPAISEYGPLELRAQTDDEFVDFMSQFLKNADTGIEKITTEEQPFDFSEQFSDMPDKLREEMRSHVKEGSGIIFNAHNQKYALVQGEDGTIQTVQIKTSHKMEDGSFTSFEIHQESEGTQRLMNLLPALADLKKEENVYVIDELDRRMHPLLTRMFLETFLDDESSEQQSQLIFTTHDTNLLDTSLLRRDEIWFISKNEQGSSELVSLSDYSVRKDLRIDKGYLLGRFGAVPYTKNVNPVQNLIAQ